MINSQILLTAFQQGSTYQTTVKDYNSLSMGQMGNSVCQLYFQYNNLYPAEYLKPELARTFSLGNAVEDILVKAISSIDLGYTYETQVRLETLIVQGRSRLNGYVDTLMKGSKYNYVLEFKSMNDNSFSKLKKNGVKISHINYYTQVQLYLHVGGYSSPGFLVAMNKNTSEIHIEEIPYDKEYAESMIKKAKYVIRMEHPLEDLKNKEYPRVCSKCFDKEICHCCRK